MKTVRQRAAARALTRGMTLIELMISLVLGLMITGAALAVFSANKQTYTATESLGRIQETIRVAFELMSRDVREASGNPCANDIPMANVLNSPASLWYTDFSGGILGYEGSQAFADAGFGTGAGQRVSGTDAIELKSSIATDIVVSTKMPVSSADIEVSSTDGLQNNDLIMICDYRQVSIFQITQLPSGLKLQHNSGNGSPGNCTKSLGSTETGTVVCTNGAGALPHLYDENAVVATLRATRWYIGCNGRVACATPGGKSLYQANLRNNAGVLGVSADEIAEGVDDMSLGYLVRGGTDYQPATAIANWNDVVSVRLDLTMAGKERVGVGGGVLDRRLQHVVALRNRAP